MDSIIQNYVAQFSNAGTRVGATYREGTGVAVRLWAPKASGVSIAWEGGETNPLQREEDGYFTGLFPAAKPGDRYRFVLDGKTRIADPASRFQPEDTDGPSEVVAEDFAWTDRNWKNIPVEEWVIYEIHPGTYSGTHDFDGIIADLPRLKSLGVTTLEIMPVSQFSGSRNWGYDGVFPHAVQHSYGGPRKLKELVDACHAQGLAIILDVVYNHLGPEGNVLYQCGPYNTGKYHLPWGDALNFDGEDSDQVRRYFLQSAWQWLTEYHFDGLRLDAVQMIFDTSPIHFLQELSLLKKEAEKLRGHELVLIAESDMNDSRLLVPVERNGSGLDGHWADDLHHALHATLAGEHDGYYSDYGGVEQLAKIYERGVAFEGEYSPFRKRRHGRCYQETDKRRLVVETQNHDQTGNRLKGERLITLTDFERAKLGAASVLLSPFMPFLFMGEELACEQPFQYFISHHDENLVDIIIKSRKEEWKSFGWKEEPPNPADPEIFESCVLHEKTPQPGSREEAMTEYYRALIALSKEIRQSGAPQVTHDKETQQITLSYGGRLVVLLAFGGRETQFNAPDKAQLVLQSSAVQEKGGEIAVKPGTIPPYSASVWRM